MLSVVPTRRARPARRGGALVALVLLLSALGVGPAAAHNALRSTDPADGSTVPTAPAQVTLTFDQPALEIGTQVVVTGPDGAVVSDGPAQLVDASVVQPLVTTLPAGAYTVDWRVTSADGHPLSGALAFTAAEASGVTAPTDDEPTDPATPTEDASGEPTATAEPTLAVTADATVSATDTDTDDGVPAGVWLAIAAGVLLAVGGGATAAVVTARRRAAEGDGSTPGETTPPAAP